MRDDGVSKVAISREFLSILLGAGEEGTQECVELGVVDGFTDRDEPESVAVWRQIFDAIDDEETVGAGKTVRGEREGYEARANGDGIVDNDPFAR